MTTAIQGLYNGKVSNDMKQADKFMYLLLKEKFKFNCTEPLREVSYKLLTEHAVTKESGMHIYQETPLTAIPCGWEPRFDFMWDGKPYEVKEEETNAIRKGKNTAGTGNTAVEFAKVNQENIGKGIRLILDSKIYGQKWAVPTQPYFEHSAVSLSLPHTQYFYVIRLLHYQNQGEDYRVCLTFSKEQLLQIVEETAHSIRINDDDEWNSSFIYLSNTYDFIMHPFSTIVDLSHCTTFEPEKGKPTVFLPNKESIIFDPLEMKLRPQREFPPEYYSVKSIFNTEFPKQISKI